MLERLADNKLRKEVKKDLSYWTVPTDPIELKLSLKKLGCDIKYTNIFRIIEDIKQSI